jgi:hypothetical protein
LKKRVQPPVDHAILSLHIVNQYPDERRLRGMVIEKLFEAAPFFARVAEMLEMNIPVLPFFARELYLLAAELSEEGYILELHRGNFPPR